MTNTPAMFTARGQIGGFATKYSWLAEDLGESRRSSGIRDSLKLEYCHSWFHEVAVMDVWKG